jgi:peroxiredoxin family protein
MSSIVIGLASGSLEKLVVTSTVTGGAVALDMDVDIYLLLGGAYAFRKDIADAGGTYVDRADLKDEMLAGMANNSVPAPLDSLRRLKQDGNVRIHCCGTAGKIWGAGALEDFIDIVDDIVGIAEYITKCEEADVVQVF